MNNQSKTVNVTKGMVWGFAYKGIGTVLPFVMRTVILYQFGALYLGVNSLFSSILNVLNLAELGVGSAMIYSMYKPVAEGDEIKVCALLHLYKRTYYMIGTCILLLGLLLLPFIKHIIKGEVPANLNLYVVYLIYLINTSISYFMFSYKQSVLFASQRVDLVNIISLLSTAVQYFFQLIAISCLKDYYLYMCMMLLCTFLNNLLIHLTVTKRYPRLKSGGMLEEDAKMEIFRNVRALFISKLGAVVRNSADNIVISSFLGLAIVGKYNNYFYIISAVMMLFSIIMEAVKPSVGNLLVTSDQNKIIKDFYTFNILYVFLVSLVSIVFLCLCQPFMELWAGENNMFGFDIVLLLAAYLYIHKFCDMLSIYQEAAGMWWYTRWIPAAAALVNLVTNIILVIKIGLPGVILSTIMSVLFVYLSGYTHILFRRLFKQDGGSVKYIIHQVYLTMCTIGAGLCTYFVCKHINLKSLIMTVAARLLTSVIMSVVILTILFSKSQYFYYAKQFLDDHFIAKLRTKHT